MSTGDLKKLRDNLPELFLDWNVPNSWTEELAFIPLGTADTMQVSEVEASLSPLASDTVAFIPMGAAVATTEFVAAGLKLSEDNRFGGAPTPVPTGPTPPAPDALAFYLPFHYFHPQWWGIYLIAEGVEELARFLEQETNGTLSSEEAIQVARLFLYGHEAFHHAVECFATRLEIVNRSPLYRTHFEAVYRSGMNRDASLEEGLASAKGYALVADKAFGSREKAKTRAALYAIEQYLGALPLAYQGALDLLTPSRFRDGRMRLAEENHGACFPGSSVAAEVWATFPQAFGPIGRVTSRVNYVVRRGGSLWHRLPANVRDLRYREVIQKLRAAGCRFVRQGKGSHEIWETSSGERFSVPRHPGDLAQGTAQGILKRVLGQSVVA
jgi:predicted RNA binding protein YcfA (HicA-like mRNA interferase family)